MNLANELLKEFSKATVAEEKKKEEYAYGTARIVDGDVFVQLDGSDILTPAQNTMDVKTGDRVSVLIKNHSAMITGNISVPADASKTLAQAAYDSARSAATSANQARESAATALEKAEEAIESAETAQNAADSAVADAGRALTAAQTAETNASNAVASAGRAETAAQTAETNAENAVASAGRAETAAQTADSKAEAATQSANEAKASATIANETANGAVTSLGIVQNVVDALETDMDDMQTHVAMMDAVVDPQTGETIVPAGLHVVPTSSGYFIVISNDGMYVYDPQSVLVATFGENINFNSYRPQRIGGEDAYVEYYDSDNDGQADSLRIVGANITVSGGKDVTQLIDESSRLIYDHDYTYSGTDVSFIAHLYKGIEEVTSNYPPECFTWYLKSESGIEYLNSGYTITLSETLFDYRATVVGRFENEVEYALIDSEDYRILDSNGNQIITHAIY